MFLFCFLMDSMVRICKEKKYAEGASWLGRAFASSEYVACFENSYQVRGDSLRDVACGIACHVFENKRESVEVVNVCGNGNSSIDGYVFEERSLGKKDRKKFASRLEDLDIAVLD